MTYAKETCPRCKKRLEIDIEPFEGTVYYCRTCQKIVKLLPIKQAKDGYKLPTF
jgi:hypothetical protein